MPNYNIYDIFWNETLSGINITDYNFCSIYRSGMSTYSTYRIHEEKDNRQTELRNNKLNFILQMDLNLV